MAVKFTERVTGNNSVSLHVIGVTVKKNAALQGDGLEASLYNCIFTQPLALLFQSFRFRLIKSPVARIYLYFDSNTATVTSLYNTEHNEKVLLGFLHAATIMQIYC